MCACVCLLGPVLKYSVLLPGYQAGYKAARPRACQNKITSLARKHDKTSEFQQINVNFNCIHLARAGPGSSSGLPVYESLRMESLSSQTGQMKICIPCIEQKGEREQNRKWKGGISSVIETKFHCSFKFIEYICWRSRIIFWSHSMNKSIKIILWVIIFFL